MIYRDIWYIGFKVSIWDFAKSTCSTVSGKFMIIKQLDPEGFGHGLCLVISVPRCPDARRFPEHPVPLNSEVNPQ